MSAEAVPALEVRDLRVAFQTRSAVVQAVGLTGLVVHRGETLAVVGESGSGKSVTAQAVMGLLDPAIARVTAGEIRFHGTDIRRLSEVEQRRLRGAKIALVPQDAMAALNPLVPVGRQIGEMFQVHRSATPKEALEEAVRMMERVGIPSPRERAHELPHQFSGGMRQRLVIAMAVALSPDVLIADEATSALDVTTQIEIIRMLEGLKTELDMSIVFITHDLLAVQHIADRVLVMYAGRVLEAGPAAAVFANPSHPYTRALLRSTPRLDGTTELEPISGRPPGAARSVAGCVFAPRCSYRHDECTETTPPLVELGGGRRSACLFAESFQERGAV